jgi:hypothetical protein
MNKMPRSLTKRRTALGVPLGRRQTDWDKIRKLSLVGAGIVGGAVASAAAGLRVRKVGLPKSLRNLPQRVPGRFGRRKGDGKTDKAEARASSGDESKRNSKGAARTKTATKKARATRSSKS